jgi:hypothetical protein
VALFGKVLCEARVPLWNLEAVDDGEPAFASVAIRDETNIDGRPSLAYLVPLVAVTLLRNSRNQRELASPMMQLIGLAAEAMRADEGRSRRLRMREAVSMTPEQMLSDDPEMAAAGMIGVGLPELVDASLDTRPNTTFEGQLRMPRRGGVPLGVVKGVGNGYQAALGFFALLEHVARHEPYSAVAQPAGTALTVLSELYFDAFNEQPPSFSDATGLYAAMYDIVLAAPR